LIRDTNVNLLPAQSLSKQDLPVSTTIAATAISTTATTTCVCVTSTTLPTARTTTRVSASLTLNLALAGKSICTDVTKGSFHGVGLCRSGIFVISVAAIITPLLPTTGKSTACVTSKAAGWLAISRARHLTTGAGTKSRTASAPVTSTRGIRALFWRLELMRLLAQCIRILRCHLLAGR
jgi:hypothetical protein